MIRSALTDVLEQELGIAAVLAAASGVDDPQTAYVSPGRGFGLVMTSNDVRSDYELKAGRETCLVCGNPIRVMSFRGLGFCSTRCRESGFGQLTEAPF